MVDLEFFADFAVLFFFFNYFQAICYFLAYDFALGFNIICCSLFVLGQSAMDRSRG